MSSTRLSLELPTEFNMIDSSVYTDSVYTQGNSVYTTGYPCEMTFREADLNYGRTAEPHPRDSVGINITDVVYGPTGKAYCATGPIGSVFPLNYGYNTPGYVSSSSYSPYSSDSEDEPELAAISETPRVFGGLADEEYDLLPASVTVRKTMKPNPIYRAFAHEIARIKENKQYAAIDRAVAKGHVETRAVAKGHVETRAVAKEYVNADIRSRIDYLNIDHAIGSGFVNTRKK
jgi:hypothetical protein